MQRQQNPLLKQTSTLLHKLQSLPNEEILRGADPNGIPWLKHLFDLHEQLFGETCTGCPTKIPGYINRVKKYTMSESKQTHQYRLKSGVMILVPGTKIAYTEHNITDAIAKKLLAQNPNRASLFISIPKKEEKKKTTKGSNKE